MAASAKFTGNVAKSFILAAERCELTKKISETQLEMLLVPAITNRAFAIELYLKAILLSENKEEEGHRLDKLYKKLTADNKKRIVDTLGVEESKFERDIGSISNTFMKWRYIHEVQEASLNLDFLKNLSYAVKQVHEKIVQ